MAMREILNYNNIPILNNSLSPNFLFYETEEHFALEKISSLDKYTIIRGILKGHHLGPKDETFHLYSQMKKNSQMIIIICLNLILCLKKKK